MQKFKGLIYKIAVVIGTFISLLTGASLFYDTGLWYFQILNFPRLGFFFILIISLLIALLLKKWKSNSNKFFLVTLIVAIFIQGYIIFPYTFFAPDKVEEADTSLKDLPADVSIMVANVLMTNRKVDRFFEITKEVSPDILITLEPDSWWINQMTILQTEYPYRILYPASNTYGMAIYSRLKIINHQIYFLNHDSVPSMVATIRLSDDKIFRMMAVHPVAPVPSGHPTNIGSVDEKSLKLAGNMVARDTIPTILAGDFNDVGWSHNLKEFEKRSKLKDTRRGRGMYNTFNAQSWIFRWPLDYIFVSHQWKVTELERLDEFGSDHFPFLVKLVLE